MIREELGRLWRWEERHKRLVARLSIAVALTVVVDVVGAILIWRLELHAHGTEIHGIGDAFFFTTVQLLTISSQLENPLTAAGRVVDVGLEIWALVVAALAGSFSSFFASADRSVRAYSGASQTTPSGGSVTSAEWRWSCQGFPPRSRRPYSPRPSRRRAPNRC